jgi:RimJ/RimL family protein N-acetyltransferase
MLRGKLVGLRARYESDVPVLADELYGDVATASTADRRPWRPISPGTRAARYQVSEPADDHASFSVVELDGGALAGACVLWAIDPHNRSAHLGLGLRPAFRGRGLGTDTVAVLCHYGFVVLGLHRLQVDTLTDNHAMIKAAERCGFATEGVNRDAAWVTGQFKDEVVLGLLADQWGTDERRPATS